MQFTANGPDIPDRLLQAHEEGRVVFFCGAGISYPAGLPGFKGLVDEIYRLVGTTRNPIEQDAYTRNQFDATLDLLERRLPGQRLAMGKALMQALKPKMRRKGATATHAALLQLARNREGALRLVTTNFDRIFEVIGKRNKPLSNTYVAPLLPIPKNSRWDGLVYLHGLLPKNIDDDALHRLVFTSGDFGLAYLIERWAARFVSELFRNYVVCFVGYSINDPVLRYMMDALAADRMLGETSPQAYALGDYESGQERTKTIEWKAKGVAPILYEIPAGTHDHSALHHTLKVWAETYRDGILGKERIALDCALARPSASTQQDDFVGRMLWALSDKSGLPAKRFADFNPAPSLEWLEAFSADSYGHDDLIRFGIPPHVEADDQLRFSLIRRPAPYALTPWMSLVCGGTAASQWDDVMFQLARWLLRHLNDPALIIWLTERGGQLHDQWLVMIDLELDRFSRLEQEGKAAELEEIRANSPNAIPQPPMRILWRLLLTGRVKSFGPNQDFYRWQKRLKRDGLTTTRRLQLRDLLAPKVVLKKPFRWFEDDENTETPVHLKQFVDYELVLASNHARSTIMRLSDSDHWSNALPELLDDFQQLLRDALDLLCELGEGDDYSDRSNWDLPSISSHRQNRGFREWVVLIELLRDAWLAVREIDHIRATQIAQEWFALPYPTFKRLALFAASHDLCISADQWVDWLVTNDSWWLWSTDTKRETMRLLVLQGIHLSPDAKEKLETAILAGPPRSMYRDDIEHEHWQSIMERSVWLHLAKLQQGGGDLGHAASLRLSDLSVANPAWKLETNQSDEFSCWMSGTGDPDYEDSRDIDIAPRKRRELVSWLKRPPPSQRPVYEHTWRDSCRTRFYHCTYALCDLAKEGSWPTGYWRDALQVWSEEGQELRSWRFASPLIQTMPDTVLQEIARSFSWWLEAVSKSIDRNEFILLDMCRRVLALEYQDDVNNDDPVARAVNHPVGHATQALLNLWFKGEPNDSELLSGDVESLFTQLCDTRKEMFRHGRVVLASHLIALFRVDRPWTEKHLLPLFDWTSNPMEAKVAWESFLRSPRRYTPLMIAFKAQFLDTAHYYEQLGEHSGQFAAFLTYAALDLVDDYTPQDFREAFGSLPQEGLRESAQALAQALDGAGDQREEYWKNRIQPFWQEIWPKSRELASNNIAESLARLSIAAHGAFPLALSAVLDWLRPFEHPDYVVGLLCESDLVRRFPEDALRLLNAIIDDQPWISGDLEDCLKTISDTVPALLDDNRYQRLVEYSRRRSTS